MRSLLQKGQFDIKLKSRQVIRQIKVNFGYVQVKIGTVQDANSTKSSKILGQYKVIFRQNKVNFGYVQVKIGTVQDDNSTKSSEILGQYMIDRNCNVLPIVE